MLRPSTVFVALLTFHIIESNATDILQNSDRGFTLKREESLLSITAISNEIIRVRLTTPTQLNDDRSFAVDLSYREPVTIAVTGDDKATTLKTSALIVNVQHQPMRVEFFDKQGRSLDRDDNERGLQHYKNGWQLSKRLRDDEQIYGLGEKTGKLNKRGVALGGYHYTMWNSDTYGYDSSVDPIYVSVPFYLVLREGNTHGIFLDNSFRTSFDIGKAQRGVLTMSADGGEVNYYFIAGPDPKSVIARYTDLTGKTPLPPRWALGFHQSRWSYFPESRLRLIANTFRDKKIPADTLWLDIDYLQDFTPFIWNRDYFPQPQNMIADLQQQGFQVVTIVDPHPKNEVGYAPYDQGIAGDHFVKNPDGSVFEGPVWPSNAKTPRNSVFPDFTRATTRHWWGDLHKELLAQGVAGIWNDMNEPAVWIAPHNTMPIDVQHQNDGYPTTQAEIHNVYGLLHTRATHEGLLRLRPGKRPFVLTRATYAGGQKYAAVWPGDNTSDWSSLRQSLPTLMGMGVSGFNFVGADIGGFAGVPSGELFTRWLQASLFSPFMRAHTQQGTPDQEPWSYGAAFEAINRRTLEWRYQLLPMIYSEMEASSRSGVPLMRPLFVEFPHDAGTWSRDDQFMFGGDVLVAPVLHEGAAQRATYLPKGKWFAWESSQSIEGGREISVDVTLASIPMFVREGAVVLRQPTVQHTGEMNTQPLTFDIYPAASSSREFYSDAGDSFAYHDGDYMRLQITQKRQRERNEYAITRRGGHYQSSAPYFEMRLIGVHAARSVMLDGKPLTKLSAAHAPAQRDGWMIRDGDVVVRWSTINRDHRVSVAH